MKKALTIDTFTGQITINGSSEATKKFSGFAPGTQVQLTVKNNVHKGTVQGVGAPNDGSREKTVLYCTFTGDGGKATYVAEKNLQSLQAIQ